MKREKRKQPTREENLEAALTMLVILGATREHIEHLVHAVRPLYSGVGVNHTQYEAMLDRLFATPSAV